MFKIIISTVLIVVSVLQYGFVMAQDSTNNYLSERYIDRPLTLHKNNLEFAFSYQFGALMSIFNENGDHINIADEGISSSNQMLNFQLTYGITERLQVQALLSNYSYKKTSQLVIQYGFGYTFKYINGLETSKGFFDPSIRLNYLLIGNDKKLSLSIGGGISIPVAKYKPESPMIDSSLLRVQNGFSSVNYVFNYRYHNGTGAPVYNLNMALKFRPGSISGTDFSSKIIARLYTDYYTAPAKVSTNDWQYVFDAGNPNDYTFQPLAIKQKKGDWLINRLYIDYQAYSIVSFMLGASSVIYFHGWNQTESMKIAENDVSETSLLIGAHFQASPRLRIDQLFTLPVAGKSTESYFNCQFALIYKIF